MAIDQLVIWLKLDMSMSNIFYDFPTDENKKLPRQSISGDAQGHVSLGAVNVHHIFWTLLNWLHLALVIF